MTFFKVLLEVALFLKFCPLCLYQRHKLPYTCGPVRKSHELLESSDPNSNLWYLSDGSATKSFEFSSLNFYPLLRLDRVWMESLLVSRTSSSTELLSPVTWVFVFPRKIQENIRNGGIQLLRLQLGGGELSKCELMQNRGGMLLSMGTLPIIF